MKKNSNEYIGTPKIRKYEANKIEDDFIKECFHKPRMKDPEEDLLTILFGMIMLMLMIIGSVVYYTHVTNAIKQDLETHINTKTVILPTIHVTMPVFAEERPEVTDDQVINKPEEEYLITAYCSCIECCDKTDGITASGALVKEGITCAADWSILPLGSVLEIEGIGTRFVQDKGSAVKGKRIDVYFNSHEEALKFGRQIRKVTVVS